MLDVLGRAKNVKSLVELGEREIGGGGGEIGRAPSVQEEVANIDVVRYICRLKYQLLRTCLKVLYLFRTGKICQRCFGPMEEFPPHRLISEAASQISDTAVKEVKYI